MTYSWSQIGFAVLLRQSDPRSKMAAVFLVSQQPMLRLCIVCVYVRIHLILEETTGVKTFFRLVQYFRLNNAGTVVQWCRAWIVRWGGYHINYIKTWLYLEQPCYCPRGQGIMLFGRFIICCPPSSDEEVIFIPGAGLSPLMQLNWCYLKSSDLKHRHIYLVFK